VFGSVAFYQERGLPIPSRKKYRSKNPKDQSEDEKNAKTNDQQSSTTTTTTTNVTTAMEEQKSLIRYLSK
jgi:hypothetical protein